MTDAFETLLESVRTEMAEPDPGPTTPAELAAHSVATRLNSIWSELDDMIAISRNFDAPDLQQAVCSEVRAVGGIAARAAVLASFVEAMQPRGLRLVKGRAS